MSTRFEIRVHHEDVVLKLRPGHPVREHPAGQQCRQRRPPFIGQHRHQTIAVVQRLVQRLTGGVAEIHAATRQRSGKLVPGHRPVLGQHPGHHIDEPRTRRGQ
jgi:hypothetical protein